MIVRSAYLALAFATSFVSAAGAQSAQGDLVKRGDYLVNGIMTCANCHSPKGPPAADQKPAQPADQQPAPAPDQPAEKKKE